MILRVCLLFLIASSYVLSAPGIKDEKKEKFGYVEVRKGAHMFWVSYPSEILGDKSEQPLILWIQGGPGASGTGFGNFMEIGPRNINGTLRDGRWTKKANLLFLDNPVGAGFSYVEDPSLLSTTNAEIAEDLTTALQSIFLENPEMQKMPFFIYAESYGGKMTVTTALLLQNKIASGEISCNFKGVSLGDSWISPVDSINSWGELLYTMGMVDDHGKKVISDAAASVQKQVDGENWEAATKAFGTTESLISSQTGGIRFYNIFDNTNENSDSSTYMMEVASNTRYLMVGEDEPTDDAKEDPLTNFMNKHQKKRWNIPEKVSFGEKQMMVFEYLSQDFMKPVVAEVRQLVEAGEIQVTIYSGDLDLICATLGTLNWIKKMGGDAEKNFQTAAHKILRNPINDEILGYTKRYNNLALITFMKAGHMVPIDSPAGALEMIDLNVQWAEEIHPKEDDASQNLTVKKAAAVVETQKKITKTLKDVKEKTTKQTTKESVKKQIKKTKETIKTRRDDNQNTEKKLDGAEVKAQISGNAESKTQISERIENLKDKNTRNETPKSHGETSSFGEEKNEEPKENEDEQTVLFASSKQIDGLEKKTEKRSTKDNIKVSTSEGEKKVQGQIQDKIENIKVDPKPIVTKAKEIHLTTEDAKKTLETPSTVNLKPDNVKDSSGDPKHINTLNKVIQKHPKAAEKAKKYYKKHRFTSKVQQKKQERNNEKVAKMEKQKIVKPNMKQKDKKLHDENLSERRNENSVPAPANEKSPEVTEEKIPHEENGTENVSDNAEGYAKTKENVHRKQNVKTMPATSKENSVNKVVQENKNDEEIDVVEDKMAKISADQVKSPVAQEDLSEPSNGENATKKAIKKKITAHQTKKLENEMNEISSDKQEPARTEETVKTKEQKPIKETAEVIGTRDSNESNIETAKEIVSPKNKEEVVNKVIEASKEEPEKKALEIESIAKEKDHIETLPQVLKRLKKQKLAKNHPEFFKKTKKAPQHHMSHRNSKMMTQHMKLQHEK